MSNSWDPDQKFATVNFSRYTIYGLKMPEKWTQFILPYDIVTMGVNMP